MTLNPALHGRIASRLGEVHVIHEGERMEARYRREAGGVTMHVDSRGETYKANCPFCGDTRKRLYINHRYGTLDAVTGRRVGGAKCFNEDCLSDEANRDRLAQILFGRARLGAHFAISAGHAPVRRTPVLPGPCRPLHELPDGHHAKEYIRSRGHDPVELGAILGVSYCIEASCPEFSQAANRVVIPFFMNGTLAGWQARYIGDRPKSFFKEFGIAKYFTMPGMESGAVLYNYDNAKSCKNVVIVEGPADVWAVGRPSVCVTGHTIGPKQRKLIADAWPGGAAIVMFDEDAVETAMKMSVSLHGLVGKVVMVVPPAGKDPGGMPRGEIWALIESACLAEGVSLS